MKQYLKCLILVAFVAMLVSPKAITRHAVAASALVRKPEAVATAVAAPAPAPVAPVAAVAVASTPAPVAAVLTPHEQIMQAAGIAPADWSAVTYILDHESGWCPTKSEGEIGIGCPAYHGYSSDGYGMCQSTPAIKMSVEGAGWETDPVLQLKWCTSHAAQYGGWQGAYQHWLSHHNW